MNPHKMIERIEKVLRIAGLSDKYDFKVEIPPEAARLENGGDYVHIHLNKNEIDLNELTHLKKIIWDNLTPNSGVNLSVINNSLVIIVKW